MIRKSRRRRCPRRSEKWFDHTLYSRLNDKRRGAIAIVMQRLVEDDLVGLVLFGDRRRGQGASHRDDLGIGMPFGAVRAEPCTPSAAARKPRRHPPHARQI